MSVVTKLSFLILLCIGCKSAAQLDYSMDRTIVLVDSLGCDTLNKRYSTGDLTNVNDIYRLALTEYKCGDHKKAVEYLKRAIALDGNEPFEHYALANLFVEKNDVTDALNEIQKAESLFPNNYYIEVSKAEILYYNHNIKECLQILNYIERYDKTRSDTYRIRALIFRGEQNIDKGYENIKIAIHNDPENPWLYYLAGDILIIGKRYKEAVPYLTKSIEMDTSDADFYLRRGVAFYYSGEIQKASDDWHKSLNMGNKKAREYINTYLK